MSDGAKIGRQAVMQIIPILASGESIIGFMLWVICMIYPFWLFVTGAGFCRSNKPILKKKGEMMVTTGLLLAILISFLFPLFLRFLP